MRTLSPAIAGLWCRCTQVAGADADRNAKLHFASPIKFEWRSANGEAKQLRVPSYRFINSGIARLASEIVAATVAPCASLIVSLKHSCHKQGRGFPLFERDGVKFGVIICADGGYIEPARILALKGARIIVAPHFNNIVNPGLLALFLKVRSDHTARAIENSIWFVRGNNVVLDPAKSGIKGDVGVGCGDSYIMDPGGEILVRSRRHIEDFIMADIDTSRGPDVSFGLSQSAWIYREFGKLLEEAAKS